MDFHRLSDIVKKYSPAHFKDICVVLASLADEMEHTKVALSAALIKAGNHDDFTKAKEILAAQEEVAQINTNIRNLLAESGFWEENAEVDVEDSDDVDSSGQYGYIDYSFFKVDDTVAYDIENTPVTFKKPAAFSFKGKLYRVNEWKTMLVKFCEILYTENPQILKNMGTKGKKTGKGYVKMSENKNVLLSPKKIPGTNIWIETNLSAADIQKKMLILLEKYNFSTEDVKLYFSKDYTALHE